jgi:hypothetical protein
MIGGLPGGTWSTWAYPPGISFSYDHGTGSGEKEFNFVASSIHNPTYWPEVTAGARRKGVWFPVIQGAVPNTLTGEFYPAIGIRNETGEMVSVDVQGNYLSSQVMYGGTSFVGLNFTMSGNSGMAWPATGIYFYWAVGVRCVIEPIITP